MKLFKCKLCSKMFNDVIDYIRHLDAEHSDEIPPDFSPERFYYYLKTGKKHGTCVQCKSETEFNDETLKYKRYCSSKCLDEYAKMFKERMIRAGKADQMTDPEHQRKMIAAKKNANNYTWSDGVLKSYIGSYELSFLQFLDNMNYHSDDVITPSPHTYYYNDNGVTRFYIPDMYIASLNLEIEIKDGGKNPNTHPKIMAVDKVKEKLKDETMKNNKFTNYLKITDKNNIMFLKYLEVARDRFNNNDTRLIHIY